jgi:hypothetical protein
MKAHCHTEDTPVYLRRQKAQRPAERPRPALARTRTDRLKRQMLGMDRAGQPCACDDKTPCLPMPGSPAAADGSGRDDDRGPALGRALLVQRLRFNAYARGGCAYEVAAP